jgi:hypothetical protein
MKGFFIPNYHIYRTDRFPGRTGVSTVAVGKGIPQNHVDLLARVSVEALGICIPIDNNKILLADVYRSARHTWIDANIIELLRF